MRKIGTKRGDILCAIFSSTLFFQALSFSYAADQEEFSFDQTVVTATRVPTKASETASNVTVITKEEIEQGHYTSLGEILRQVNGIIVTDNGFPGSAETLRINGDDRVLVMIDGRKISRPEGVSSDHASVDLSSMISLDNIERIEIVKGGASALYGSDAVGGVVNIITRKGAENKTSFKTSFGSWGAQNYSMSTQGTQGKFSWYITADKKKQDHVDYNPLTGGDTKSWPNSSFDGQGLTVQLDNVIDDNRSVTFNFEHWNDKSGQPYALSWPLKDTAMHLWNNWALTYNFNQKEAVPGSIRVYANYDSQSFDGVYRSRTTGLSYQTGWKMDEKNTVVAGTSFEKGEVLQNTGQDGTTNYDNKDITNTAVYLQDVYKMAPKWTLMPGIRYDHFNKFGGQTTPKLNINYSADSNTDMYVTYNKVFRAPNLDDLYYNNPYAHGNPNLQPETGNVVTVGINKKISEKTAVSASYFDSKVDNAIYWYSDPVTYQSYKAENTDEKKHGFELDLKHKFSEKYFAQIGYSYLRVELDQGDGNGYQVFAKNSQPNGYRVQLGYNDARWDVGIQGISATGRNVYQFVNSSFWVWNVSVNYRFNKEMSGFFKINNLTNTAYELMPSAVGDYPMPARNFQAGVQYQF